MNKLVILAALLAALFIAPFAASPRPTRAAEATITVSVSGNVVTVDGCGFNAGAGIKSIGAQLVGDDFFSAGFSFTTSNGCIQGTFTVAAGTYDVFAANGSFSSNTTKVGHAISNVVRIVV